MKKKSNITILTGLIRSGKTTLLMKWMDRHPLSRGILTPDIDGIRFFLHYPNKQLIKMQVFDEQEEVIHIGKFIFSKPNFKQVNQLLIEDMKTAEFEWLVIDEIGLLELKEQGLFTALQYALHNDFQKIIIVVREKLLDKVIEKFELKNAVVIYKEDLENKLEYI